MQVQSGSLYLTRDSVRLAFLNLNEVEFTDSKEPVLLNFNNNSGEPARYLTTGKVYFPVVNLDSNLYLYATPNKNKFILSDSMLLPNRIFLYLPPGKIYTSDTNLTGYFFVYGSTEDQSTLAEFNTNLTDRIYLKPAVTGNSQILAQDSEEVADQANSITPNCTYNNIYGNGECNGSCFGRCPEKYQCVRKGNQYLCQENSNSGWLWLLFILIILLLALTTFLFLWLKPTSSGKSNQASVSNAVLT